MSERGLNALDYFSELNDCHRAIQRSGNDLLNHAFRAGELLSLIKNCCEHGEFTPLLENHFDGSKATAHRYVQVYIRLAGISKSCRVKLLEESGGIAEALSRLNPKSVEQDDSECEQAEDVEDSESESRHHVLPDYQDEEEPALSCGKERTGEREEKKPKQAKPPTTEKGAWEKEAVARHGQSISAVGVLTRFFTHIKKESVFEQPLDDIHAYLLEWKPRFAGTAGGPDQPDVPQNVQLALNAGSDLRNAISMIGRALNTVQAIADTGAGRHLLMSQIKTDARNLQTAIRVAIPHDICPYCKGNGCDSAKQKLKKLPSCDGLGWMTREQLAGIVE